MVAAEQQQRYFAAAAAVGLVQGVLADIRRSQEGEAGILAAVEDSHHSLVVGRSLALGRHSLAEEDTPLVGIPAAVVDSLTSSNLDCSNSALRVTQSKHAHSKVASSLGTNLHVIDE